MKPRKIDDAFKRLHEALGDGTTRRRGAIARGVARARAHAAACDFGYLRVKALLDQQCYWGRAGCSRARARHRGRRLSLSRPRPRLAPAGGGGGGARARARARAPARARRAAPGALARRPRLLRAQRAPAARVLPRGRQPPVLALRAREHGGAARRVGRVLVRAARADARRRRRRRARRARAARALVRVLLAADRRRARRCCGRRSRARASSSGARAYGAVARPTLAADAGGLRARRVRARGCSAQSSCGHAHEMTPALCGPLAWTRARRVGAPPVPRRGVAVLARCGRRRGSASAAATCARAVRVRALAQGARSSPRRRLAPRARARAGRGRSRPSGGASRRRRVLDTPVDALFAYPRRTARHASTRNDGGGGGGGGARARPHAPCPCKRWRIRRLKIGGGSRHRALRCRSRNQKCRRRRWRGAEGPPPTSPGSGHKWTPKQWASFVFFFVVVVFGDKPTHEPQFVIHDVRWLLIPACGRQVGFDGPRELIFL